VKAEFSFEVERPFLRATGEPVSDLFLVDVWEDLGRWAVEHIKQGTRLLVIGTLNKESYSTRSGREHLTIVKAKYIRALDGGLSDGDLDLEEMRRDCWSEDMLLAAVRLVERSLEEAQQDKLSSAADL